MRATTNDGHGQHQFAGYLTPLAFKAAADPAQYPEQLAEGLRPWQARKFYRAGGRGANNAVTPQVQTGIVDPVIGRSYAAIAAKGAASTSRRRWAASSRSGLQRPGCT